MKDILIDLLIRIYKEAYKVWLKEDTDSFEFFPEWVMREIEGNFFHNPNLEESEVNRIFKRYKTLAGRE